MQNFGKHVAVALAIVGRAAPLLGTARGVAVEAAFFSDL